MWRHRTANLNLQSGRYTPFEEDDFYVPNEFQWRLQSKSNKQGSEGHLDAAEAHDFTQYLMVHYTEGYRLYQLALENGIAKEQARLFLPGFAVYYSMVWKIDAHNLLHFLSLRRAAEAQYEIRVYAEVIWEQFFKPALPWTAEAAEKFERI